MPINSASCNFNWKPEDFSLKDLNNNTLNFYNCFGEKGLLVMFICNHCPYVIAIVERLSKEAKEMSKLSINTIAIMSNDVMQYPDDSFENMKLFAKNYNFIFPYLFDESQEVAKQYGAVCTPDIFGFNYKNLLCYRGRIDSGVMNSDHKKIDRELYNDMVKIKNDGIGPDKQLNSFGCSIKWK